MLLTFNVRISAFAANEQLFSIQKLLCGQDLLTLLPALFHIAIRDIFQRQMKIVHFVHLVLSRFLTLLSYLVSLYSCPVFSWPGVVCVLLGGEGA